MRMVLGGAISAKQMPILFSKFSSSVGNAALSAALNRMGRAILADGKIDYQETEQLLRLLDGIEGQEEFRKALVAAHADGVISLEESANLERFISKLSQRNALGKVCK